MTNYEYNQPVQVFTSGAWADGFAFSYLTADGTRAMVRDTTDGGRSGERLMSAIRPVALVIEETAPVCGCCGGEGNCPECMVWDAPLTEVLADLFNEGFADVEDSAYHDVEAAVLAAYPVVEVASAVPDILTRLGVASWALRSDRPTQTETDVMDAMLDAAAEIRRLRAEVEALKNPPYRIVMDESLDGDPHPYRARVMRGDYEIPFDGNWWKHETDASWEAQTFIDKLTAPFGGKGG